MKCDAIKKQIYNSVNTESEQLDKATIRHIAQCQDCMDYHDEILKVKSIAVKLNQQQPILDNPKELTNRIMEAIDDLETVPHTSSSDSLIWVKRFLAAASVLLLLMFSYEQTLVTNKLIKLEEQMSEVQGNTHQLSHAKRLLNYYPTQGMDVIKTELASRNIVLTDNHLASLILRVKSKTLSPEELSNLMKYRFIHLKVPNQKINVINALNK